MSHDQNNNYKFLNNGHDKASSALKTLVWLALLLYEHKNTLIKLLNQLL